MPVAATAVSGRDVVGDGGAGLVLVDLVVGHADADHEAEGEDEVGDRAGEGDEHALPAGMVVELAGIVGDFFAGDFAGHLDVAAEGQDVDLVVGFAAAEADEALAEADGEGFDADAAPLGHDEVAELVNEDHEAEHEEELDDGGDHR